MQCYCIKDKNVHAISVLVQFPVRFDSFWRFLMDQQHCLPNFELIVDLYHPYQLKHKKSQNVQVLQ